MTPDFYVVPGGTIVMVQPVTEDAHAWIAENASIEPWQWRGDYFVCEPRMAGDLIDVMRAEGFEVEA